MSHKLSVSFLLLVFSFLSARFLGAQPLVIDGVADRTSYITTAISFRVQTTPGHSYYVLLDGKPVPAGATNRVTVPDYHEIVVSRTNVTTLEVTNRTVRFIIMSVNRNDAPDGPENGLIEWTPYPQIPSTSDELAGAALELIAPSDYPIGLEIPIIARVGNPSGHARRVSGVVSSSGFPSFRILRGHGSGFLPSGTPGTPIEYTGQMGSLSAFKEINIDAAMTWTTVSGTLVGNVTWPDNSRIHITGNLTVPGTSTLTIGAGTIIKINPLVNITNTGRTVVNGTAGQPVVFTSTNRVLPHVRTHAWGGFFLRNAAAELVANGTIFVGGGGASSISFSPGSSHRSEQAVFLVHSGARLYLTNCAIINTAGQVANGFNSDVTYDHCLLQRAITAGEYVGATIIVNHSAIIEFPEDNGVVDVNIAKADYDAIYFTEGTHLIYNSLIGFCKDDAIDSGSGGAGTVLVTNCWIESALHEANAWSGSGRVAETYNSVLINSGQGFECGWSSGNNSPLTYAGSLLSIGNSVGARFGDNYPNIGPYNGLLRVTNSFVLHNYRDVWGMTWRTDNTGWFYRSNQMDVRTSFISQANAFHPTNTVWNGAQDGWRLAPFMTTPANAPVGVGIATWTDTLPITSLFDGIPVRLSSFTTNSVTVHYLFQQASLWVLPGSITFAPGETVKRIYPYGWDFSIYPILQFSLSSVEGGELTGRDVITFQGNMPAPALRNIYPPNAQLDRARLSEAFPVGLTFPGGVPTTFAYQYEWTGGIISTGVVTFAPGETLAWAPAPEGDLTGIDLARFKLLNPPGAPVFAYFVKSANTPVPPPTTLVSMGAVWKYPNVVGQPAANWRELTFDDSSWLSGAAQLGFSNGEENDEATLIANLGPQGQVTYYFRRIFNVADPNAFTNVSLTLLRDDAGVVHLNGNEVYRSPNLPAFPALIGHGTTSGTPNGENTIDQATISRTNLIAGLNIAAVDIHQQGTGSSDVSFSLELIGNAAPVAGPPQRLYFGEFDGQLVFAWGDPTFILEHANAITGPWTTAATSSPFLVTPDPLIPQKFFRLKR